MKYILCSVRDVKSEVYGRPFCVTSVGQAIRSFDDEINNSREDNIMFKHYGDFSLYQVGVYDDSTASIEVINPKILIEGAQVKKQLAEVHKISKV